MINFLAKIDQLVEEEFNWLNRLGNRLIGYPFPIEDCQEVHKTYFLLHKGCLPSWGEPFLDQNPIKLPIVTYQILNIQQLVNRLTRKDLLVQFLVSSWKAMNNNFF